MRRKILIATGLFFVVLAAGAAILAPRFARRPAAPAAPVPVPVVAAAVDRHDVPIYLRGVGTVIAYNTVQIHSQITGQLIRIAFIEGQSVKAGDLLAEIDPSPYIAQLDQMIATRERDQAQLTNALANLTRYDQLQSKGWATAQLAETQKAQVEQLQNAVKADEALIAAAKVQLGYTKLTSPISGVTGVRLIDIGNVIHPNDPTGLVVVTQLQPISVLFTLPETYLPKIQEQMAKGRLMVIAYSQDGRIKLDQGTLGLVDNEIIQSTGTIRLKAEFPNPANRLWPGELISVRLVLETRPNGLTVPASAVQQGPLGAYAYVIDPGNTVATRPIQVAQIAGGQALIDSGLKAGEQVVVDGQYKLQPGSLVTVLHGTAAQEAAAQSAEQAQIP
jgi:multidrug efflux system membrane fusion protein